MKKKAGNFKVGEAIIAFLVVIAFCIGFMLMFGAIGNLENGGSFATFFKTIIIAGILMFPGLIDLFVCEYYEEINEEETEIKAG